MKGQTSNYRTLLVQSLIVIVVTLLLLEGVGLFVYNQQHGGIYYFRNVAAESEDSKDAAGSGVPETRNILHPYMGFMFRPGLPMSRVADRKRIRSLLDGEQSEVSWASLATNNHGFFSEFDYPYARESERELIIGIFGGSVAQWFALQGAEQLETRLQAHALFRDRDITVVNFAQGGFKQPQQLQTLSYFLALGQAFDIVVNVDGFNEIALSHFNHNNSVATSMPSAQHLIPLLGLLGGSKVEMKMIDRLHGLSVSERKLRRLERWESATKSAGLHLVLSVLHDRARKEHARDVRAIDALGSSLERTNMVHLADHLKTDSIAESIREAMDFWLGAAETMQALCDAGDILYAEVIQPNQYYSNKAFSEQERELAINADSPYREAIESGYRELPDLVRRMREQGINVTSAVDLFDDAEGQTYSDSCCHYNQAGNDMLADRVAESIIALAEGRGTAASAHRETE